MYIGRHLGWDTILLLRHALNVPLVMVGLPFAKVGRSKHRGLNRDVARFNHGWPLEHFVGHIRS